MSSQLRVQPDPTGQTGQLSGPYALLLNTSCTLDMERPLTSSQSSDHLETPLDIPKQHRRACTECRQQKARCDSYLNPEQPCSRCRRLNVRCVISEQFRRQRKRRYRRQSEHEDADTTDREASRLPKHIQEPVNPLSSPVEILMAAAAADEVSRTTTAPITDLQARPSPSLNVAGTPRGCNGGLTAQPAPDSTKPQHLDGIQIDACDIDEIFELYFKEYAYFMPILDASISPNVYYQRSPFLFWAIIGVGSRHYRKDPTLFGALAPKIINLALMSLKTKSATLSHIQALLLVLSWPFPPSSLCMDITFPLSGSLIHMAMQAGLHISVTSQNFAKIGIKMTEEDIKKRAELWAYCIITYQRACCYMGHSPLAILDTTQDLGQIQSLFQKIPSSLRLQLKLQSIVARCCATLLEIGLRSLSEEKERTLDLLLRVFDGQIKEVEYEAPADLDQICLHISRLNIQVFHFYKASPMQQTEALSGLFTSACSVIESMDRFNTTNTCATSPLYFSYGILLACYTLLRILKSSFAKYLDFEKSKRTFFLGIDIAKRLSTENNDIAAKNAVILARLWNSDKVFRLADGREYTTLKVRSRLAMGVVLDAVWCYRQEYGRFSGLQLSRQEESQIGPQQNSTITSDDSAVENNDPTLAVDPLEFPDFLDDQLLVNFGLSMDSNAMIPFMLN
ncbi:hypothetical protein VTN00DRAFT_6612 [Thermoascus crustaceus]|uniref:uncharacterized protein n=1 Tax=Thermoascus crustaceus TaxID=5088 RepID=UPI0037448807